MKRGIVSLMSYEAKNRFLLICVLCAVGLSQASLAFEISTERGAKDAISTSPNRIRIHTSSSQVEPAKDWRDSIPAMHQIVPKGMAMDMGNGLYLTSDGIYKNLENGALLTPDGLLIKTDTGALLTLPIIPNK